MSPQRDAGPTIGVASCLVLGLAVAARLLLIPLIIRVGGGLLSVRVLLLASVSRLVVSRLSLSRLSIWLLLAIALLLAVALLLTITLLLAVALLLAIAPLGCRLLGIRIVLLVLLGQRVGRTAVPICSLVIVLSHQTGQPAILHQEDQIARKGKGFGAFNSVQLGCRAE